MSSTPPYLLDLAAAGFPSLPQSSGADPWPALEDPLLAPDAPDEVLRGRPLPPRPAGPARADRQGRLAYLLAAHVRPGYVVATRLRARVGPASDLVTDVCVRRGGLDAAGRRHLESLAFDVVTTEAPQDLAERAEDLRARGVRRVFIVFAQRGEVCEWQAGWRRVERELADPLLVRPLPLYGLLDAVAADDLVVHALDDKGSRALRQIRQIAETQGQRQALLTLLVARGIDIGPHARARIERCQDLADLTGWIARAATATSLEQVFPVGGLSALR